MGSPRSMPGRSRLVADPFDLCAVCSNVSDPEEDAGRSNVSQIVAGGPPHGGGSRQSLVLDALATEGPVFRSCHRRGDKINVLDGGRSRTWPGYPTTHHAGLCGCISQRSNKVSSSGTRTKEGPSHDCDPDIPLA